MKIKLINFYYNDVGWINTPLGLGYLNATLKSQGHESEIALFPELEFRAFNFLQPLIKNLQLSPLRSQETLEIASNDIFAKELGFIEGNDDELEQSKLNSLFSVMKRIGDKLSEADIVGFSVMYPISAGPTFYLSKYLKEKNKDIKIIWGGPTMDVFKWIFTSNNSFYKSFRIALKKDKKFELFKNFLLKYVDFLVHGEGEDTLLEIVRKLSMSKKDHSILGSTVIDNNKFYFNEDRPLLDINKLPAPDFDKIDLSWYYRLSFHLSRGCIANCKFCDENIYWRRFRIRNPKDVVNEIETQIERYGTKRFFGVDSLLNGSPLILNKFCKELIKSKLSIDWEGNLRFDLTNKALLDNLKKAGFIHPFFGLETLNQRILDSMEKRQSINHVIKIIKYCKEIGIPPILYVMIGYPGMTFREELKVCQKINSLKNNFQMLVISIADLKIRTQLLNDTEKYGFKFFHTTSTDDQKLWNSSSLVHSYIPGFYTFTQNGLKREELDLLGDMYNKINLKSMPWRLCGYSYFLPKKVGKKLRSWSYKKLFW